MPSTRRETLGAGAGLLGACLAGCNALYGDDSSSAEVGAGDPVTGYATARHVVDGERALFRWTGSTDRPSDQLLVRSDEERSAVTFPGEDSPVRRFVAETDLEAAVVVLVQRRHGACLRLDAFGVSRRPDELRVHTCREPRPADERCRTGDRRSTALALRLSIEGSSVPELSVVDSSRCENRFGPYREGGER